MVVSNGQFDSTTQERSTEKKKKKKLHYSTEVLVFLTGSFCCGHLENLNNLALHLVNFMLLYFNRCAKECLRDLADTALHRDRKVYIEQNLQVQLPIQNNQYIRIGTVEKRLTKLVEYTSDLNGTMSFN